jgi:hypothetical protein
MHRIQGEGNLLFKCLLLPLGDPYALKLSFVEMDIHILLFSIFYKFYAIHHLIQTIYKT